MILVRFGLELLISVTLVGCALVQDDGNWNKAAKLQQGCDAELAACASASFGTQNIK
jgi:hypothetical protein